VNHAAGRIDQAAARIDRITQSAALIGFFGLALMGLLIFYDGSARALGWPRVAGFSDYGELILPVVIASCFPAGLLRRSNLSIRLLGKRLGERASAWLETGAAAATLLFFGLLAWQFAVMSSDFSAAGRTTPTREMMLAPWWWGVTFIMVVSSLVQVYVLTAWARAAIMGTVPALETLAAALDHPAVTSDD